MHQEDFKPLVKATAGFEYRALKPDAPDFVQQKWGYIGTRPGVGGRGWLGWASMFGSFTGTWSHGFRTVEVRGLMLPNLVCTGDWVELELATALDPAHPQGQTYVCEWC